MSFYQLQNEYYFIKEWFVDRDAVSDITYTRQSATTRVGIRFLLHGVIHCHLVDDVVS